MNQSLDPMEKLCKLQKKAIRLIFSARGNVHTDNFFALSKIIPINGTEVKSYLLRLNPKFRTKMAVFVAVYFGSILSNIKLAYYIAATLGVCTQCNSQN